jgi:cytidylate kinase
MRSQNAENKVQIDYKTSRSICDGIGERLQRSLRPETSRLSSRLQHLMDELRRRDSEDRTRSCN